MRVWEKSLSLFELDIFYREVDENEKNVLDYRYDDDDEFT